MQDCLFVVVSSINVCISISGQTNIKMHLAIGFRRSDVPSAWLIYSYFILRLGFARGAHNSLGGPETEL
jgi:hypothetical protein